MEVLRHIHDLNGKEVYVEGWLEPCDVYDCVLFAGKADMETAQRGKVSSQEWLDAIGRGVGVGDGGRWFNWRANSLQSQHVIIKARISDDCRDSSGKIACFDRADDLQPISIQPFVATEKMN